MEISRLWNKTTKLRSPPRGRQFICKEQKPVERQQNKQPRCVLPGSCYQRITCQHDLIFWTHVNKNDWVKERSIHSPSLWFIHPSTISVNFTLVTGHAQRLNHAFRRKSHLGIPLPLRHITLLLFLPLLLSMQMRSSRPRQLGSAAQTQYQTQWNATAQNMQSNLAHLFQNKAISPGVKAPLNLRIIALTSVTYVLNLPFVHGGLCVSVTQHVYQRLKQTLKTVVPSLLIVFVPTRRSPAPSHCDLTNHHPRI